MTDKTAPAYVTTAVSDITADEIYIRGYPLKSIMGRLPFAAATALLIRNKMPTPGEAKMIDTILCSILDYGLQKAGTVAARYVVSVNPQMVPGLAAAVLAAGDYALSPENTGRFILESLAALDSSGEEPSDFAKKLAEDCYRQKVRIPGFGHPVFRSIDPRAQKLKDAAIEHGIWGRTGRFYEAIHQAFKSTANKPDLVINDVGMIACILAEMGYTPQEMAGIAILSTIPGVIAHISEELASNKRVRILPDSIAGHDHARRDLDVDMTKAGWRGEAR